MTDYMSDYGAEDERRSQIRRKVVFALLVLFGAVFIWWMWFRNFTEERQLAGFVEAIKAKNYQRGCAMFARNSRTPCTDYTYPNFLADCGPAGRFKHAGQVVSERRHRSRGSPRPARTLPTPR